MNRYSNPAAPYNAIPDYLAPGEWVTERELAERMGRDVGNLLITAYVRGLVVRRWDGWERKQGSAYLWARAADQGAAS